MKRKKSKLDQQAVLATAFPWANMAIWYGYLATIDSSMLTRCQPRRDDYDGDDGSDNLLEDVSDKEIDINSEGTIEYIRQALDTNPECNPTWEQLLSALGMYSMIVI